MTYCRKNMKYINLQKEKELKSLIGCNSEYTLFRYMCAHPLLNK